ncbi:MAG: ABC transporter permease, partial [Bacilli bacterium]|nr:ABC transporter permease [Bacilli bacterium]
MLIRDRSITDTLEKQEEVEVTAKLDTDSLANATRYFNFVSYSILAGCVYVIAVILASFRETKIEKRTVISSTNYKKYNRELFLSNGILAIILWLLYYLLSIILLGKTMFTMHGLLYLINSLVFTFCALALAFLISTIVNNKNAINGIVNVVALGSSFLCGAFVPMEWLPNSVLKIAHLLPTYYYIKSNELLTKIEVFNLETLKPILLNMVIILIFMILFVVITNMISRSKRKIG